MRENLSNLLKKYVALFINEYASFLNKEQLEILKNINYDKIIKLVDINIPVGFVDYNHIYVSDKIINIQSANPLNDSWINNKSYTSYLKYITTHNYDSYKYYSDQLMFMVFKLIIPGNNGLINGLINYEINSLRRKYKFQAVNLYGREEVISIKVAKILGHDICKKIMFKDMPSAFKYLNDNTGYRYAEFYYQLSVLVDRVYCQLKIDNYDDADCLVKYASDYDHLLYGDAYNYLLDFSISNNQI